MSAGNSLAEDDNFLGWRSGTAVFSLIIWLILAAILVPPMFFERFLTGYWPNSPVLPLVLAWAVIGFHLWASHGATAVVEAQL